MTRIDTAINKPFRNIMLDLETLGTSPGCKILGIGATVMGRSKVRYESFEMYAHRDPQTRLVEEKATVDWWNSQKPEVRDLVLSNPKSMPLSSVLFAFSEWLEELDCVPIIWGNSASFDCRILEFAYKIYNIPVPWNFRNEMCFRTLKNLPHGVTAPVPTGLKHTPLVDAMAQAQWAEDIYDSF